MDEFKEESTGPTVRGMRDEGKGSARMTLRFLA